MRHDDDEPWVQIATRISKPLHQAVRLYCVEKDILLMHFVAQALARDGRRAGRRRVSG